MYIYYSVEALVLILVPVLFTTAVVVIGGSSNSLSVFTRSEGERARERGQNYM